MPPREPAWSTVAGCYAFLCGTVLVASLDPIHHTMAAILGVESGYLALVLASPAAVLGAAAWWTVVERAGPDSHLRGALFGGVTAVATVTAWVLRALSVWGFELVASGWFVIAWMFALTAVAGVVTGLTLVVVRRRLVDDRPRLT